METERREDGTVTRTGVWQLVKREFEELEKKARILHRAEHSPPAAAGAPAPDADTDELGQSEKPQHKLPGSTEARSLKVEDLIDTDASGLKVEEVRMAKELQSMLPSHQYTPEDKRVEKLIATNENTGNIDEALYTQFVQEMSAKVTKELSAALDTASRTSGRLPHVSVLETSYHMNLAKRRADACILPKSCPKLDVVAEYMRRKSSNNALVAHGRPGSGKSSLVCKAVLEMAAKRSRVSEHGMPPEDQQLLGTRILLRFVGASHLASNVTLPPFILMHSVLA
eukprot:1892740-Rhodomonas_salina.3